MTPTIGSAGSEKTSGTLSERTNPLFRELLKAQIDELELKLTEHPLFVNYPDIQGCFDFSGRVIRLKGQTAITLGRNSKYGIFEVDNEMVKEFLGESDPDRNFVESSHYCITQLGYFLLLGMKHHPNTLEALHRERNSSEWKIEAMEDLHQTMKPDEFKPTSNTDLPYSYWNLFPGANYKFLEVAPDGALLTPLGNSAFTELLKKAYPGKDGDISDPSNPVRRLRGGTTLSQDIFPKSQRD